MCEPIRNTDDRQASRETARQQQAQAEAQAKVSEFSSRTNPDGSRVLNVPPGATVHIILP